MTWSRTSAARVTFVATRRARTPAASISVSLSRWVPARSIRGAAQAAGPVVSGSTSMRRTMTASSTARATSAFDARATCVSPAAVMIVTSLSADVEADVRARDVVDDHRVDALARELVAAMVKRAVAVLGREADQRLAGTPRRRQPGEDVRRALQLDAHALVGGLLQLAREAARGPEVGDRRGHEQDVGALELLGARGLKLARRLDVEIAHARVAR